ncbi:MAG: hybrid sensor histidine kinase/response regulator [Desulfuromonadaceae bacterium]
MRSSRRHSLLTDVAVTAIMAGFFLLATAASPTHAAVVVPRVLVLNSYTMSYDWSENEMKGVRAGFAKAFQRSELFVEYLDTKNFPTKKHFPRLADLLETKYAHHPLDVIIAMDNAALEFAVQYRQRISPGTPLVFCGINGYEPSLIAGQSSVTGVAEQLDSAGTLGLALRLHPAVRDVVVIHDYTDTGLAMRREMEKTAALYPGIKLEYLDEMPLERAVEKLKSLSAGHLVLMLSYTVEKGGRAFSQSEAARLVSGASPVPVYSVHAAQLGNGVVGGLMMEGAIQGQKAAELAVRILGGEPPEKLHVITGNLSHPMFDYQVLEKYGISTANLPADALLINTPSSTVVINKTAAWLGGAFTLSSMIGLTLLALNIRKRRRVEEMLRCTINQYQESQEELQLTEEMLRTQVDDYMQSEDELQATEEMLRVQIDDYVRSQDALLATEEMLRVQLEAVEESSQKFKAVFEHSPITVALTTLPEGVFSDVNQAFIDMFGYSREEVLGKTTLELGVWLRVSDRDHYLQLLRDKGFVQNFEVEMCRAGGEAITVLLSGVSLEIAGRACVLSALMDMSEQKRLQSLLSQSQKMEVVGQLAGGIAHDFNNMLAGIMAAAELLKLRLGDDEKDRKLLETILAATTRSADLTSELLTFSRKGTVALSPVHIHETIAAVMGLLERTIDKQIQLVSRLEAVDPVVLGDQTQLQNALLNLGVNARDAMPHGGTLRYATTVRAMDEAACRSGGISLPVGRYLEVAVSDTGSGMTKAVMEHIFEPFFTTKGVGKGTGLGLAAVYGAIKNHHGEICVNSQPGHGSVFKIYLPLVAGDSNTQTIKDDVITGSGGILLVDDEEMLRSLGRELLEELGYTVYLAENGEQALEVFAAHRHEISLVILDMIMPKMGGKEAFMHLREEAPGVKVLFCSGFSCDGTGDELVKLGASGFIQKPYNLSELSRIVASALG